MLVRTDLITLGSGRLTGLDLAAEKTAVIEFRGEPGLVCEIESSEDRAV